MKKSISDEPRRPSKEEFRDRLALHLKSFTRRLILAEIGVNNYKTLVIELDELSTPTLTRQVAAGRAEFFARLARLAAAEHDTIVILSARAEHNDADLAELRNAHPEAEPVELPGADGEAIMRALLLRVPLRCRYELVVLRRVHGEERLEVGCQRLFSEGAEPGETARSPVICTSPHGTLLAVCVWRGPTDLLGLLSVHRAALPAGPYSLEVRLDRPGKVGFPAITGLTDDDRPWSEIVAAIPERLNFARQPAHLICAIEACGSQDELNERRERLRELITKIVAIHQAPDGLLISVVAYGGHDFASWRGEHSRPQVVAWAVPEPQAVEALDRIRSQPVTDPDGAQVEDMLAEVETRVAAMDPGSAIALVTVGRRAPHPPKATPNEDLLPCPNRYDWAASIQRLSEHLSVRLGAICDLHPARTPQVWERLGAHGLFFLDACDADALAVQLGLATSSGSAPQLPLSGINGGFSGD